MTLRLSPEILARAWDFLRETQPFKGWRCFPEAEDIGFAVIRDPSAYGDFSVDNHQPMVRVSERTIGHTVSLMSIMGHEMAHYRQWSLGKKISHGRDFKAMQKAICAAHGFDPKVF
jgi:hypothetical protein